jgi:penicillin-binding protein 1A
MNGEPAAAPAPRHVWRNRVLASLAVVCLLLGLLWQRCGVRGCPNVERLTSYQPGGATVLLDATGRQFATLAPVTHDVIALDSLPAYVPAAFLAIEDKRFYRHDGADIRAGRFVQGFSTITMQLARNVWPDRLPGQRRTLRRKVLEMRVAYDIERHYKKNEILELYLNHIYFGDGAYGIEAASRNYFGKSAKSLALAEAAVLAALPKSPTLYNPRRYREPARARRDLVLRLMVEQGRVPRAEATAAAERRLTVRREPPRPRQEAGTAPYFVDAVRRVLEDRFGEDVYTAPLRVYTTLSPRMQQVAERQLEQQLKAIERGAYGSYEGERYQQGVELQNELAYVQGALVLMDAATGDVKALVGGRDFTQSRFDRATQSRRQVGSAFKPFVFAAALAEGYAPSQLVSDSVLRLELPGNEVWEPHNFDGEYEGAVTLREALVRSKNVPTIRLAADVGLPDVTRMARRAGVRSELPSVPSVAIGTAGLTPLELTGAYTPFARLGTGVVPRLITRVEDADGRVIWRWRVEEREVMDSAVAYLVTDMLQEAVLRGTATSVRNSGYHATAAGKTGTTNDGADVWFVGYTPSYVASVWIGFDRPVPITDDATGNRLAAPVWARVMRELGGETNTGSWRRPSNLLELRVDPTTGLVLRDGCRPLRGAAQTELFIEGHEPASSCPAGTPTLVERGWLARAGGWIGRQWRRVSRWVTQHVGTEEPQPTPREGEYLGVPRLPTAAEVIDSVPTPRQRPKRREPLGVPVPYPGAPDTTKRDTLRRDTLRLDTLRIRRDTVRRDTVRPRPDTLTELSSAGPAAAPTSGTRTARSSAGTSTSRPRAVGRMANAAPFPTRRRTGTARSPAVRRGGHRARVTWLSPSGRRGCDRRAPERWCARPVRRRACAASLPGTRRNPARAS